MTLAGKTILVTGASGFLGGALARRLAEEGAQVKALVRSPEKAAYLRADPRIEIVQGDILDAAQMQKIMAGCEIVFHVAAALSGDYAHQYRVNVEGTRNIMTAAASVGVQRVVHISSLAVYGYQYHAVITESTEPVFTHDPYSTTKRLAEQEVREIGETQGLSYAILRSGMIYGPRSRTWTKRMFRLATRNPFIFLGNGRGTMPLIHIDDVVDLCIIAAVHPNAHRETFNLVMDPAPTWREYLSKYADAVGGRRWIGLPVLPVRLLVMIAALFAGKQASIKDVPAMLNLSSRRFCYDMSKAREKLGWQPRTDLMTGLKTSLDWLRQSKLLD